MAKGPEWAKPDYGVDAPAVMRNFFLAGGACLVLSFVLPEPLRIGRVLFDSRSLLYPAFFLLLSGGLFLLYVKFGKFRHRDFMLDMVPWLGSERVLDVGCGRGLLLVGAAKRLTTGHATGIDIWSNEDMGGNSPAATEHNIALEGMTARCTLLSIKVQEMSFASGIFDVIVSNLCLHNIYDRPARMEALRQIARVLAPGGTVLLSDYKLTREYAKELEACGLDVTRRHGSFLTTFPPLDVVIARKPA